MLCYINSAPPIVALHHGKMAGSGERCLSLLSHAELGTYLKTGINAKVSLVIGVVISVCQHGNMFFLKARPRTVVIIALICVSFFMCVF